MTADNAVAKSPREQNWLLLLESAAQEVFEIVLRCKVKPTQPSPGLQVGGFTAIVGLAGALCGIMTTCCAPETAEQIAKRMLGETTVTDRETVDALGEMCNMIAGNFKNKLAGTDERCKLSVPTVVKGKQYRLHSLVDGTCVETLLQFEEAPFTVR